MIDGCTCCPVNQCTLLVVSGASVSAVPSQKVNHRLVSCHHCHLQCSVPICVTHIDDREISIQKHCSNLCRFVAAAVMQSSSTQRVRHIDRCLQRSISFWYKTTKIQLQSWQIPNYALFETFVELHFDKLQELEESNHDYRHNAEAGIAAPYESHYSTLSETILFGSGFLSTFYAKYAPPVSTWIIQEKI